MIEVQLAEETDFEGWRKAARALATNDVAPEDVAWAVAGTQDHDLFAMAADPLPDPREVGSFAVSREFVDRAGLVICHRDPQRFAFLYRLLFRIRRENRLLRNATDPDVRQLEAMEKSIRRDIHKMRAFVRFRKAGQDCERYVAWFEPQHHIVERNAEFFVKRFTGMEWTILTPDRSASWNGSTLTIGPGASKSGLPGGDSTEDLWKTYFSSIFNPARLKTKAMTAEMPKKYWKNMPEAALIPGMIAGAGEAHRAMMAKAPTLPPVRHAAVQARYWQAGEPDIEAEEATNLATLRRQAESCTRCALHCDATQTVFGEGPADAKIVFVGEQPGDQEDLQGRAFVGPAGKVFDEALETAGIERNVAYVTNAVKHFKFTPRGKRRIHQKPNAGEVRACRWWVENEVRLIRPKLLVALGATAALSLLDRSVAITRERGTVICRSSDGLPVLITVHPSYLLRLRDEAEREHARESFINDLQVARDMLKQPIARR